MSPKYMVALIAFLQSLAGGCGGPSRADYAQEIRLVISQDKSFYDPNLLELVIGPSQSTEDVYVSRLKTLNLSRCPPEFQEAFRAHIKAWEMHSTSRRLGSSATQAARRSIEDTWLKVNEVASEYGVTDGMKH